LDVSFQRRFASYTSCASRDPEGLSGISAYSPTSSSHVEVTAVENTFSDTVTSHTKADGTYAWINVSRNKFLYNTPVFITINGGTTFTRQDNSGYQYFVGSSLYHDGHF
jgi:hypothetical protein